MQTLRLFFLLLSPALAAAGPGPQASYYEENTPGKPTKGISYLEYDQGGEWVIEVRKESGVQKVICDGQGATLSWVPDAFRGTPVEKPAHDHPGLPWFQTQVQLQNFVLSPRSEVHFVALMGHLDPRLQAQNFVELVATKKEKKDGLWKVHITFADPRALFWGADYWFGDTDGVLVRYQEVRGGPGTPATVGTLVRRNP